MENLVTVGQWWWYLVRAECLSCRSYTLIWSFAQKNLRIQVQKWLWYPRYQRCSEWEFYKMKSLHGTWCQWRCSVPKPAPAGLFWQELRGTDISVLFAVTHCSRVTAVEHTSGYLCRKQPPLIISVLLPLVFPDLSPPFLLSREWLQVKTAACPWQQPLKHSFLTRQVCFAKGSGNRAPTLSSSAASLRMSLNKISDNPFTKRSTDF